MFPIAYEQLAVCIKAAPNGKVQAAFSALYNDYIKDRPDITDLELTARMASTLCDGIWYGSWPQG